jgi:DNA-directed RNA polymerase sigma subunit (sigma70/sigma32)
MFYTDDPMEVYLKELRRIPPMDRAEEIACMEHVRAGNEMAEAATKRLVEANLSLVVTLAEHHRSEHVHILDLIVKGNEGLLHAVEDLANHAPDSFAPHATFIERALVEAAQSGPPKT